MKFEHTSVWGFEHALRGMRNPLNSWDKSDSHYETVHEYVQRITELSNTFSNNFSLLPFVPKYNIGEKDMKLCKQLIKGGSEHRKFLRQIFVSVDITAPLYWWKEFDTYKVGTVANSTSTMHKLATTPITLDCFETDDYDETLSVHTNFEVGDISENIIIYLESLRQKYLETKDKSYWKELVRLLPEGWLQKRTITLSYENLLTIYHQRKEHKLNEWSGKDNNTLNNFIKWMIGLPYMKDFLDALND